MKKFFCLISLLVVGYCCFADTYFRYDKKNNIYYKYNEETGEKEIYDYTAEECNLPEECCNEMIKECEEKFIPDYEIRYKEVDKELKECPVTNTRQRTKLKQKKKEIKKLKEEAEAWRDFITKYKEFKYGNSN